MNSLLRYNKEQLYCFLDFETESLNVLKSNRPWEVGLLICTKDKILEETEFYIKWPDLNVGKGAAQATKFYEKQHDVETKGISPKEALDKIDSFLLNPDYIIVAQNGIGFDFYIHKILREELGLPPDYSYVDRFIDTYCVEKGIQLEANFPEFLSDSWTGLMYQLKNTAHKGIKASLGALCKKYGIEYDPELAHAALYDCQKTREVFMKQMWAVEI